MGESAIHWTDYTWNPTTGCDRVSPGCDHCYAMTLAARLQRMGNPRYANDGNPRTSGPGFGLTLHEDKLTEPLRWRKPRHVFVDSMSDLFHSDVPEWFIGRVFQVMEQAAAHKFQVLTKRPRRMRDLLRRWQRDGMLVAADPDMRQQDWAPSPNVWLGTSVEDQKRADLRVPLLLETPAAVRFLSCEPLLGPIDLRGVLDANVHCAACGLLSSAVWSCTCSCHNAGLDWVIVGGESGGGHRPIDVDWARVLRDQCAGAGIAFFYKQGSGPRPGMHRELDGKVHEAMPA